MKAPKPAGQEIQVLVPEQARAMLQSACTNRLEALFVLAGTIGMRQGELLGLKWADVDMKTGILVVRRTLSTATGRGFSSTPRRRPRVDAASSYRSRPSPL